MPRNVARAFDTGEKKKPPKLALA